MIGLGLRIVRMPSSVIEDPAFFTVAKIFICLSEISVLHILTLQHSALRRQTVPVYAVVGFGLVRLRLE